MMYGTFRAGHPQIRLTVIGINGPFELEFIIDTGFEGDIVLPLEMRHFGGRPDDIRDRMLADGSIYKCPCYDAMVDTGNGTKLVQAFVFGPNALVGTEFFENHVLHAELFEGGEIIVEPPD